MPSEREKMLAGQLYDPLDPELVRARERARDLCHDLNATREADQETRHRILKELFGKGGEAAPSQPLQVGDRPLVPHVAGVERRGRLEQQDVGLLVGHRAVLDAAGHDQERALLQPDVSVPELHAEAALHDEEKLILVVVVVPDERPLELDELHLLAVQLGDDLGLPLLAEA